MRFSLDLSAVDREIWIQAQTASKDDDLPRVEALMADLLSRHPTSAVFNAIYANTLKLLNRADDAVAYFARAVSLDPDEELFSLGLFHCLWRLGRKHEALQEMRRFTSLHESKEYAGMSDEISRG